jgi:hypothetical protein
MHLWHLFEPPEHLVRCRHKIIAETAALPLVPSERPVDLDPHGWVKD